jgi:hypothetical protein
METSTTASVAVDGGGGETTGVSCSGVVGVVGGISAGVLTTQIFFPAVVSYLEKGEGLLLSR